MNILKVFFLSFILLFAFGVIFAQEVPPAEVTEAVNLDEDIQPADLEVGEPKVLPDNPFYFLKNWGRAIQSFFTFNPVKKVELRLKFANERIIEAKKLVEKKADSEILKRATSNYEEEIDRIKERCEEFKIKAEENPELNKFLDKYITHQALHHQILQRLETQVPPEVFEKIKEARERHLERFTDVMTKLEEMEKIPERLEKNLEKIKGSDFKEIKDLEMLKELEERLPKEIKEKIVERKEKMIEKFHKKLEKMSPEAKERFKGYLEEISGDKIIHLDLITSLEGEELSEEMKEVIEKARKAKIEEIEKMVMTKEKAEAQIEKAEEEISKAEEAIAKIDPEIYKGKAAIRLLEVAKDHLAKAKEALEEGKYGKAYALATAAYHQALAVERFAERMEEWKKFPEKMEEKFLELYPEIPLPEDITKCKLMAPPRCPQGRAEMEISPEGCPTFKCLPLPAPPEGIVCYMIWDPVCGEDGKTYPNDCVAEKIAGVKIAYKGICKETIRKPLEKIEKLEEELKVKIEEEKMKELRHLKELKEKFPF